MLFQIIGSIALLSCVFYALVSVGSPQATLRNVSEVLDPIKLIK